MSPADFAQAFAAQSSERDPTSCVQMIDAWLLNRAGRSPVAIGGQGWSSVDDAQAMLRDRALPIRMARAMRAAGFRPTADPEEGDVASIVAEQLVTCALRVGSMWTFCALGQLHGVAAPRVLMAWRIG